MQKFQRKKKLSLVPDLKEPCIARIYIVHKRKRRLGGVDRSGAVLKGIDHRIGIGQQVLPAGRC